MTPEQRIYEALDSVLRASGSALKHYTMQKTLNEMREAMRKVMSDSYISGSNDNFKAMKKTPNVELTGTLKRVRVERQVRRHLTTERK